MSIITEIVILPNEVIEKIKSQILNDKTFDIEHNVKGSLWVNVSGFGVYFTSKNYITNHIGQDLYDYDSLITDIAIECISFWDTELGDLVNCSPGVEAAIINQITNEVVA